MLLAVGIQRDGNGVHVGCAVINPARLQCNCSGEFGIVEPVKTQSGEIEMVHTGAFANALFIL